ncbi:MAG: polyhydroxyalkanoate depolymerase [Stellaceae bacterium]
MIYQLYQAQSDLIEPIRTMARIAAERLWQFRAGCFDDGVMRKLAAAYELVAQLGLTHHRPNYGIDAIEIAGEEIEITEEAVEVTPFCTLLRFRKAMAVEQPRVLLVAPLSGHFATLLRDTVRTMLADHDVYITDWHNVRDVAMRHGRFGLDEYATLLIGFLERLGPDAHLVAVCQPSVPALVAVAAMAQDGNPAQPRTMTLMAGPIDARVNPTEVDEFATMRPIEWFEMNLIGIVPFRFAGAFRRVYPGFLQIAGFMTMNLDRHVKSFDDYYNHRAAGEDDKAETIRRFYKEYFAVMDLPATFYLETVAKIFQEHALARGTLCYRGTKVEPRAIRRTALFTVEGERDDICAVGQTLAAHDLCTGLKPYMKRHYVQTGVGHYGVFAGKKWHSQIYPQLRDFIHDFA